MMKKVLRLVLCLVLAATLVSSVRAAEEPVTVPVIISLTGSFALLGNTQKLALETLMKTVNEEGGINKRPLQFVFMDDGTNPATAVQFANQLIGRKVLLMLGPSSVAGCRAVAPLVTNGPVDYCLSAAGPTPKGGYSFTAGYSTIDAVRGWRSTNSSRRSSSRVARRDGCIAPRRTQCHRRANSELHRRAPWHIGRGGDLRFPRRLAAVFQRRRS